MTERAIPPYNAVVMAGKDKRRPDGSLDSYRWQEKIGNTSIIATLFTALYEARTIGDLYAVGPTELLRKEVEEQGLRLPHLIQETESFWGNIYQAMDQQQEPNRRLLVAMSDLPFLTSGSIDAFTNVCNQNLDADIIIPVIPRNTILKASPYYITHCYPMKEFPFRFGDVGMVNPLIVRNAPNLDTLVGRYRETREFKAHPLKRLKFMFDYIGPEGVAKTIIMYTSVLLQTSGLYKHQIPFCNMISMSDYERIITVLTGVKTKLVMIPSLDFVIDYDDPEQELEDYRTHYNKIMEVIKQNAHT